MKNLKALLAALGLAFSAGAAQAVILDTTSAANNFFAGNPGEGPGTAGGDGRLQNFLGIEWHANGAAFVQGFDLTSANMAGNTDDFTLTYQGFATSIYSSSSAPDLRIGSPSGGLGTYELTSVATLHERATCVIDGCSQISISLTPGTISIFDIYFDTAVNANQTAGTGFLDGTRIISGVWSAQVGGFTAFGPVSTPGSFGTGSAILFGLVNYTDNLFVSPDLGGTRFDSTLNFPGQPLVFTRPNSVNGMSTGTDSDSNFVLQADGSQMFVAAVPEPTTVALLGLGLLGFSVSRRKSARHNNT